jgi:Zn-dependent protease
MDCMLNGISLDIILILPVLLVSLVAHEYMHGLVADALGDPTPRAYGRLTLNPLKHLDPFGTLVLVITAFSGQVLFGWAKPVPINPSAFRSPQRGMMLVGAAGPLTNFALAVGAALIMRAIGPYGSSAALTMLWRVYVLNLFLAALNLIPIPPLDGSRVLGGLLPRAFYLRWVALDRYGNYLFLGLFFIILARPGTLSALFEPLLRGVARLLLPGWGF